MRILRFLRYLKLTRSKRLLFTKNGHLQVTAYTNVDWAGSLSGGQLTFGYYTLVAHNLVT